MLNVKDAYTLKVTVEDQPGGLAGVAYQLAQANIDVYGLHGAPFGQLGLVEMLVSDAEGAFNVLNDYAVVTREVLVVAGEDKPGFLAEVTGLLAEAGINVELAMGSSKGLVLGVDDLVRAKEVLSQA